VHATYQGGLEAVGTYREDDGHPVACGADWDNLLVSFAFPWARIPLVPSADPSSCSDDGVGPQMVEDLWDSDASCAVEAEAFLESVIEWGEEYGARLKAALRLVFLRCPAGPSKPHRRPAWQSQPLADL
jgi:hypothetical protein